MRKHAFLDRVLSRSLKQQAEAAAVTAAAASPTASVPRLRLDLPTDGTATPAPSPSLSAVDVAEAARRRAAQRAPPRLRLNLDFSLPSASLTAPSAAPAFAAAHPAAAAARVGSDAGDNTKAAGVVAQPTLSLRVGAARAAAPFPPLPPHATADRASERLTSQLRLAHRLGDWAAAVQLVVAHTTPAAIGAETPAEQGASAAVADTGLRLSHVSRAVHTCASEGEEECALLLLMHPLVGGRGSSDEEAAGAGVGGEKGDTGAFGAPLSLADFAMLARALEKARCPRAVMDLFDRTGPAIAATTNNNSSGNGALANGPSTPMARAALADARRAMGFVVAACDAAGDWQRAIGYVAPRLPPPRTQAVAAAPAVAPGERAAVAAAAEAAATSGDAVGPEAYAVLLGLLERAERFTEATRLLSAMPPHCQRAVAAAYATLIDRWGSGDPRARGAGRRERPF